MLVKCCQEKDPQNKAGQGEAIAYNASGGSVERSNQAVSSPYLRNIGRESTQVMLHIGQRQRLRNVSAPLAATRPARQYSSSIKSRIETEEYARTMLAVRRFNLLNRR